MAIKIKGAGNKGVIGAIGSGAISQEVEILCDTAADIASFGSGKGHVIAEGNEPTAIRVKPLPGSVAYTADASVGYKLSPSYVWTKFKG